MEKISEKLFRPLSEISTIKSLIFNYNYILKFKDEENQWRYERVIYRGDSVGYPSFVEAGTYEPLYDDYAFNDYEDVFILDSKDIDTKFEAVDNLENFELGKNYLVKIDLFVKPEYDAVKCEELNGIKDLVVYPERESLFSFINFEDVEFIEIG